MMNFGRIGLIQLQGKLKIINETTLNLLSPPQRPICVVSHSNQYIRPQPTPLMDPILQAAILFLVGLFGATYLSTLEGELVQLGLFNQRNTILTEKRMKRDAGYPRYSKIASGRASNSSDAM